MHRPNVRLMAEGAWTETCPNFRELIEQECDRMTQQTEKADLYIYNALWFLGGLFLGLVVALEWL